MKILYVLIFALSVILPANSQFVRNQFLQKETPIPYKSDALVWLDGSIYFDGTNYYFLDKSGHNKNFLITNYDFNSNWDKGFPYKSSATISAPSGDATLIAADINNYFYTNGVPNQLPVISLYQNIDYANKIFCRHQNQLLDTNQVETYEPRVKDIVWYSSAKSGSELTFCNSFFNVPEKLISGVKEVGPGKTYSTIASAITASTANETIYVYTGIYKETNYLNVSKNVIIKGVGNVIVQSTGTTIVVYSSGSNYWRLNNLTIDGEGNTSNLLGADNTVLKTHYLNNCRFIRIPNIFFNIANNVLHLKYCILDNSNECTSQLQSVSITNSLIKNCSIILTSGDCNILNNKLLYKITGQVNKSNFSLRDVSLNFIGNNIYTTNKIIISSSNSATTTKTLIINYNKCQLSTNTVAAEILFTDIKGYTPEQYELFFNYNKIYQVGEMFTGTFQRGIRVWNHKATIENNIFISESTEVFGSIDVYFSDGTSNYAYIIKNNFINTKSKSGIALSLGWEEGYLNRSDNSEISENYITGNGGSLHGIMANCGKNILVKNNKIDNCGYGIVVKSGLQDTYSSNGILYNLIKNSRVNGIIAR